MATKTTRLTIDLPRSAHQRLKTAASILGTTMRDLVLLSVEEYMHRKPNKVTEKALQQSKSGKGIKKFKNLESFFDDLGI
ncbi:MAG: hypothetical protein KGR16_08010 [Verrucomicrobia bacterium]|nr:hypothetical protein [Verrucomicrobiota bacterium]MDE3047916.1 hypothetical protein [Verrucomicrobiota bacterium]